MSEYLSAARRNANDCGGDGGAKDAQALRSAVQLIITHLESPAEAKPDIGLECERCKVAWVGESIMDAISRGWTILNQRVDYLCPSCSKPKPDADSAVEVEGFKNPALEALARNCNSLEARLESAERYAKGSEDEKEHWKSRCERFQRDVVEAEFQRDGWIKRYEVVKGQRDALKEELRAESAASNEEIVRLNELIRKGAKAMEGGP